MGGPYMEDFRLLYEFCPEMQMVSIENNSETYKRQEFNLPFRTLNLIEDDMSSFIGRYNPGDHKSVFWLDYTSLAYACFQDFAALLEIVAVNSMIKITVRSDPREYWHARPAVRPNKKKAEQFRRTFEAVMPDASINPPRAPEKLACLIQDMLQIASEKALPSGASGNSFVPVSSFYYSDGTWMLTLTGIVCDSDKIKAVERAFVNWEFANLYWNMPTRISIPVLSTKERLHLQRLLPSETASGCRLRECLGYQIEDDQQQSEEALEQYAAFHRYSPYFVRGMP
jgi:hypothetical protein